MLIAAFIILFLTVHYSIFLIRIYFGMLRLKKNNCDVTFKGFVTVLIPFRNESQIILSNLNSLEKQNYPIDKYEVIYINDSSDDDGLKKLTSAIKNENIKILNLTNNNSKCGHKKEAIKQGLEIAKGEIIVSTDSDCTHKSDWLKTMLSCFDENTAFVSGPVEFKESKGFFAKFQRLEFAGLIFAGAGLIGSGTPLICNAANLAYRKKVFDEVGGFKDNSHLSSGDDEILMRKISKTGKYKIKFCLNTEAMVMTDPNSGIRQFLNQRKRWASKGLYYSDKILVCRLIMIFLFYISLIVQPVLGLTVSDFFFRTFFISIVLKINIEFLIMWKGSDLLKMPRLLGFFLPSEIMQIPYIIYSAISGVFGNYSWRGRKLKR
jgi:cellulose synthase/poly-beta-1,6-N-acetylglucosamine synthase-like glycosyltransferase